MSCPKCGAPATDAAACPKCGLLVARMEAYAQTHGARAPRPADDPDHERLRKTAEAMLMMTATTARAQGRRPYLSSFIVLALVAVMIFVGLVFAMYMRQSRDDAPAQNPGSRPAASSQVR